VADSNGSRHWHRKGKLLARETQQSTARRTTSSSALKPLGTQERRQEVNKKKEGHNGSQQKHPKPL
jgi:hypothetical protein